MNESSVENITMWEPPGPLASDYAELLTLAIMFIVGAPLNLAAHTQLSERGSHTRLDLLKRHLNITDLLVIFVYVPSRVCWLMTYDWRGGDLLCKTVKMLHAAAFQSSSNVIVCIALDRVMSVLTTRQRPGRAAARTRSMLVIAWAIAFIISCPQLFVWQDYLAFPEHNWSQCTTIWEMFRRENTTIAETMFDVEFQYSVLHLALIFWIPAMIVCTCYIVVLTWVYINSRASPSQQARSSLSSTCETADTVITRSDWNPLRTISNQKKTNGQLLDKVETPTDSGKAAPPRIVVFDETSCPLTTRPSVCSQTPVLPSVSYHAANVSRNRAIRVSFLLVTAYIICWLPYNLLDIIRIIKPNLFRDFKHLYFLRQLMVFNSVINPYLYGFFRCYSKPTRRS